MIMWQYGEKHGKEEFKVDGQKISHPMDFAKIIGKEGPSTFRQDAQLERLFGKKNLRKQGGNISFTGTGSTAVETHDVLLMPVYRASNLDKNANEKNTIVIKNKSAYLVNSLWQVNRAQITRDIYGHKIYTPEWLSYQVINTNGTDLILGPLTPKSTTKVKDHAFRYNTYNAKGVDEKYRVFKATEEAHQAVEAKHRSRRWIQRSDKTAYIRDRTLAGVTLAEGSNPRPQGDVVHNAVNCQTLRDPIAWFNLCTPWYQTKNTNHSGFPAKGDESPARTFPYGSRFYGAYGDTIWDDSVKAEFSKIRNKNATFGPNLQHGSILGPAKVDTGDTPPSVSSGIEGGILDHGLLVNSFTRALAKSYGVSKSELTATAIFNWFQIKNWNGRSVDSSGFHATLSRMTNSRTMQKLWFEYYRKNQKMNRGNAGLLRFALEPLRSFTLNSSTRGKGPRSLAGTFKYQRMFTLTAWVLSLLDKSNNIQSVLSEKDFFVMGSGTNKSLSDFDSYKFLISFIHDLLQKANKFLHPPMRSKPPEGARLVGDAKEVNDAARAQIITNAQCLMLNVINQFSDQHYRMSAGFPSKYSSIVLTENGAVTGGGIDADHFLNLIGKRDEVLSKFLTLRPAELAVLQPRIRLFKQRKVMVGGKTKDKFVRIEVPGPFETHVNSGVEEMLKQRRGRAFGAGIKEVSVTQDGGAKLFLVPTLTNVDITFYFNRLDEIFINWPDYKPSSARDGSLDYNNPEYPFGITPGYEKNPPASVAELVFPVGIAKKDLTQEKFLNFNRPGFQVMLEMGWSIPSNNLFFKTGTGQGVVEQLRKKTLYKTFFLTPTDSEFDIKENGSVELKISYYALSEHLMEDTKNKLFPALYFPGKALAKETKAIQKLEKEIQKEKIARKNGLRKKNVSKTIEKKEAELDQLKAARRDRSFSEFLTRGVAGLFSALIGMDPGKKITSYSVPKVPLYHRIMIPRSYLGMYKDDARVERWQPYQELKDLQKFRFVGQTPNIRGRIFGAPGKGFTSTGNVFADHSLAAGSAAGMLQASRDRMKAKNREEAVRFKQLALKQLEQAKRTASMIIDKSTNALPIDFIFFGDLVQVILDYVDWQVPSDRASARLKGLEKVHFILGSIKVPIVSGNGTIAVHNIKVSDIPIVAHVLTGYIVDKIIKPQRYDISYAEFIIEFYRWFLGTYFTNLCFAGFKEIKAMSPEIQLFSMYGRKPKGSVKELNPLLKTAKGGTCYSRKEFEDRMEKYDSSVRTRKYDKDDAYHFCYLGGMTISEGTYDWEKDYQMGIHHFYIGQDTGMVKRIQFKASDIEGRAEAAWEVAKTALDKAMFMVPRIYDVTITMVGNHLFSPGQTFFVDPTMGTFLSTGKKISSKNIINSTNLGGYYFITKIESRIKAGMYETIIEGVHTGLPLGDKGKTALRAISQSEIDMKNLRKEQDNMKKKAQIESDKSFIDSYVDWSSKGGVFQD